MEVKEKNMAFYMVLDFGHCFIYYFPLHPFTKLETVIELENLYFIILL